MEVRDQLELVALRRRRGCITTLDGQVSTRTVTAVARAIRATLDRHRAVNGAVASRNRHVRALPARPVKVAISPDGKKAASAAFGDQPKLWDVESGKEVAQLKMPRNQPNVQAIAWSPTGKSLAVFEEKDIRTLFAGSGEGKAVLSGHTDTVRTLVYSADGKTIVSGASGKTIRVWDAAEGTLKGTITCADKVNEVALSPDGTLIAAAIDTTSKNNVLVFKVSDAK
ncbi:MAG TPA: hypothetical protein VFF73_21845 [Planctomycetota bacterium]|nr:hypothetical protein [Planctomycetota bacterium]